MTPLLHNTHIYTFARIDAIDQVSGTTYITKKKEEPIPLYTFIQ
jgi:hypothetical protein